MPHQGRFIVANNHITILVMNNHYYVCNLQTISVVSIPHILARLAGLHIPAQIIFNRHTCVFLRHDTFVIYILPQINVQLVVKIKIPNTSFRKALCHRLVVYSSHSVILIRTFVIYISPQIYVRTSVHQIHVLIKSQRMRV